MRLHIITGFKGRGATAQPFNIYTGTSGDEAQKAMAENKTSPRFHIFRNGGTWQKNNPNFCSEVEVPAAQEEAPPLPAAASPPHPSLGPSRSKKH